jgi:hypothetical protein
MPHYLADTSLIIDLINDRGGRRNSFANAARRHTGMLHN